MMSTKTKTLKFQIYRYNPEIDKKPRMQDYTLEVSGERDIMLLTAIEMLKEIGRAHV